MTLSLLDMVGVVENHNTDDQKELKEALCKLLFRKKVLVKDKYGRLDSFVEYGILGKNEDVVFITDEAKKNSRKLYTYLTRKFDTTSYFDPETCELVDVPKGAEFQTSIGITKDGAEMSGLVLHFPDDEITELLDLFGTNPCSSWTNKEGQTKK